jgi:hypothetical protein
MKKFILLLLLLIIRLTGISQQIFHVYECGMATYSDAFNKWIYAAPKPVVLTFLLQHKVMLVSDLTHSTYVLGELFQNVMKEDMTAFGWYAVDEEGRKCAVKIVVHRDGPLSVQIHVIYGHSCYYYNATLQSK